MAKFEWKITAKFERKIMAKFDGKSWPSLMENHGQVWTKNHGQVWSKILSKFKGNIELETTKLKISIYFAFAKKKTICIFLISNLFLCFHWLAYKSALNNIFFVVNGILTILLWKFFVHFLELWWNLN
jgi:hypothetical protein